MEHTRELAIKFWKNAEKSVGEYRDMDIAVKAISETDIKECVRHAFRDLTVRTMQKNDTYKETALSLDDMAKACCDENDGLYPLLEAWFQKPAHQDFDTWHTKACDKVIAFLKRYYIPADCSYGKAQKIVNMTIKNLYALCAVKNIEDIYATHFQPCHVPLDSFTLEWFYRENKKQKNKITKGKIASWSAIDAYGNGEADEYSAADGQKYYTYYYFQKKFRDLYPNDISPLQAEFIYWPLIQKELAAENFLFALTENITKEDKQKIREKSLQEKINDIKELLNA